MSSQVIDTGERKKLTQRENHISEGNPSVYDSGRSRKSLRPRRPARNVFPNSEERYRTTFEHTGTAMWVIDDNDTIVMTNGEFASWNGCSVADIEGKRRWQEFAHPEDLSTLSDYHERRKRGDRDVPKQYECRYVDDLGRVRNVLLTTEMIPGTRMNVVSLMDITSWRKARERASRLDQYMDRMLEQTSVWLDVVDEHDCVVIWNRAAERISGYDRNSVLGRSLIWEWLYPNPEYRQHVRQQERMVRDEGSLEEVESTIAARDGTERTILRYCGQLLGEHGEPAGAISIGRDVTEARAAEAERKEMERRAQLASRLATVGQMASGIAHEVNNPLTGIIGFAELLMQKDLAPDVMEAVATIHEAGSRLSNTVRRLLAFARQHTPERRLVDINSIIDTAVELLRYEMETNSIVLSRRLSPEIPEFIADPGQLQEVLLNLIINAKTAMKLAHGKGKLSVETRRIADVVRITVRDDGPGMTQEVAERAFEPFFTTGKDGQGTGLGLSICHEIVRAHRGRIWVKTAPGKGSTFVVELPLKSSSRVQTPVMASKNSLKAASRLPGRVLVVDDETIICRYLREGLSGAGIEVACCSNVPEAEARLVSETYDAVLLDIRLPGRSGIAFYERLKAEMPSLARRTLIMTGDAKAADIVDLVKREGIRCLPKPVSLETVKRELGRLTEQ